MKRCSCIFVMVILSLTLGAGACKAQTVLSGGHTDQGTLTERLISLPIEGFTRALDLLGLVSIRQLVFTPSNPLTGAIDRLVVKWYTQLMVVCLFILAFIFAWQAAMLGRAVSAQRRAQIMGGFTRWGMAILATAFSLALVRVLFALNNGLVDFAAGHSANFSVDAVQNTGSVLATAVVNLGLVGLKLYFNVLYTVRLVFIVVLLAVSPLVIWSLALRTGRNGFSLWAAELFSNIMMQSSHALTLAALVSLLNTGGTNTLLDRWFAKIIMICLVIPLGQFLRNLISGWLYMIDFSEERAGGFFSSGLGGISALGSILTGGGNWRNWPEGGEDDHQGGGKLPGPLSPLSGISAGGYAASWKGWPDTWGKEENSSPEQGGSVVSTGQPATENREPAQRGQFAGMGAQAGETGGTFVSSDGLTSRASGEDNAYPVPAAQITSGTISYGGPPGASLTHDKTVALPASAPAAASFDDQLDWSRLESGRQDESSRYDLAVPGSLVLVPGSMPWQEKE